MWVFLPADPRAFSPNAIGENGRRFRVTFQDMKILSNEITNFKVEKMKVLALEFFMLLYVVSITGFGRT